jgi:L,D-transpeptidase YcbB
VVLDMPFIVGKPTTPTPLFSDRLQYVVFNPYWSVPESIAIDELLPRQDAKPSYLASHHYQVLDADSEPPPRAPGARLSRGLPAGTTGQVTGAF